MAIATLDQLVNALANNSQPFVINKASLSNATTGGFHSLWTATGTPGQGANPTTAAVCTKALTGALVNFDNPTGDDALYLARCALLCSNSGADIVFADRLVHMGGLLGNTTSPQSPSIDLSGVAADRYQSDLSDVWWFLEWYADTGGTASNATVNVTYDDDSTEDLAVIAVGGTVRRSRLLPLNPATAGRKIKAVNTVTLSASTGTAGNFGVTAYRFFGNVSLGLANNSTIADWAYLGLPRVAPDSCLQLVMIPATTSTGTVIGNGRLATG